MPVLSDDARAKVNLTLRVNGRRTDGYHDLERLVAFADCADRLTLTPGPDLDLKMLGPLAEACGDTSDNLVLKAARLLAARVPGMKVGSFTLDKALPVAAGIGGGSADAAAALSSDAPRRESATGRSSGGALSRWTVARNAVRVASSRLPARM